MCAVRRYTAIATNAHLSGAAGEHALNAEAGPGSDVVTKFFEKPVPAVIGGEEQLCRARNIHAVEYKMGLRSCKPSESRSDDARPERALRSATGGPASAYSIFREDYRFAHVSVGQVGIGESGAKQARHDQIRIGQVSSGQVSVEQTGPAQVGIK